MTKIRHHIYARNDETYYSQSLPGFSVVLTAFSATDEDFSDVAGEVAFAVVCEVLY